jgi:exopolysaccharide biosynthesis predicted pyruvyltransferase EpsI
MNASYPTDAVIYIHGGGGFNTIWNGNPIEELRKAIQQHTGIVIQGPQTFETDTTFLKKFAEEVLYIPKAKRVYLFAREMTSYEALKKCLPDWVLLYIDHDTAFNLSPSDFTQVRLKNRYTLFAIRNDEESSRLLKTNPFLLWVDPIKFCKTLEQWTALHCQAKKIITNRTHSAILGAILQKPTILLPNNYHKNRSMWEYSLKAKGVQWSNDLNEYKSVKFFSFLSRFKRYQRLCNSYKLNLLLKILYKLRLGKFSWILRHNMHKQSI